MGLKCTDIDKIQTLYNLSVYEKSCRKYNKNYKKPIFSWSMKKIFDDYKKNNGEINRLFLYMPSQLCSYIIYSDVNFSWKRFFKYNIYVILKRLPVKSLALLIKDFDVYDYYPFDRTLKSDI